MIDAPVDLAVESYFRQCSVIVTVRDLAAMAATLSFGGFNPVTAERVVDEGVARDVLSLMASCGMYDFSGEWLLRVGLPAKSGVSGGLLAVAPSQFGVAAFSPRLDRTATACGRWRSSSVWRSAFGMHLLEPHESIAEPGDHGRTPARRAGGPAQRRAGIRRRGARLRRAARARRAPDGAEVTWTCVRSRACTRRRSSRCRPSSKDCRWGSGS